MMEPKTIDDLGRDLFQALKRRKTLTPISDRYSDLSIDDAYAISKEFLSQRLRENGERVIGKKIGVTSKPVQDMLNVHQPDFGFLTDAMMIKDGVVAMGALIQPRAEAEIAFRLKSSLRGPGVTPAMVIEATECVLPCFEIVDSRIADWKIKITDTIADNASCGVFALGSDEGDPRALDLPALKVIVEKNGQALSEGVGAAVQGAPQNAVAWLANTLGAYDIPFEAGEIILSGSLVPLEPVTAGDRMTMTIDGLGGCSVSFL